MLCVAGYAYPTHAATFNLAPSSGKTINVSGELFIVEGHTVSATAYNPTLNVSGNVTIATSSAFIASTSQITVGGNWTNNGVFTASSGTVVLNGASKQTLTGFATGTSAFYNLTLSNASGASATDNERTSFVPGIDFNAPVTVSGAYTIVTPSVRVEYETGMAYTFNSINWNGQAAGTKINFRNSDAVSTNKWLMKVTGTQTAVSYVNVSRSDASVSGGSAIAADNGTNYDAGLNVNWTFTGGGGGGSTYATPTPIEFVSIVDTGNASGTDYTSLSAWEAGVQADLTASTTLVFSATSTGSIADNATVALFRNGVAQNATGTVVHLASSSQQIMLDAISSSTLVYAVGDQWRVDSTHLVSLSSSTPHSAIAVAKCRTTDGSADTNGVTVYGWTTSLTNYVKIWTDPSENYRHGGVWDEGKFRIETINSDAVYIEEEYVVIQGLQTKTTITSAVNKRGIIIDATVSNSNIEITSNIIRGVKTASNSSCYGIALSSMASATTTLEISNNVIYGWLFGSDVDAGIYVGNASSSVYAYNNTVYGSYYGIVGQSSGRLTAKNNLVYSNFDNYSSAFSASSTNNLSGPRSTDNDAPGSNPQNAKIVHFADEANEDFHLDSADTGARNRGTWLATDTALALIDDIDGDSRILAASSTVDIGADENIARIYRSVGPSATTALATGGSSNYGNLEIEPAYLATSSNRVIDYIATFWRPLPDNVGVGDAIQYDSDDNGTIDKIAFITKRWDSAHFSVRTATGSVPTVTLAPDGDFGVFRAYTSLSNAENGTTENSVINGTVSNFDTWSGGKNIAVSQEQWNIPCYANGTASDTAAVINNWTTSASSFIRVYTPTNPDEVGIIQRHSGLWNVNKYRIEAASGVHGLLVSDEFVKVDGLQIHVRTTGAEYASGILFNSVLPGAKSWISNNIIYGTMAGTDTGYGIIVDDVNASAYIWNNIIYGFQRGSDANKYGISIGNNVRTLIYNNTVYGNYWGIFFGTVGGLVTVKNNISYGNADNYYTVGFDPGSDYNLSGPAQSDAPGSHSKNSAIVSFVSTATSSEDFHLAPGDYAARNAGAELSNDLVLPINTDIDSAMCRDEAVPRLYGGDAADQCLTRPRGTLWDIGADELITKIYRSVAPDDNLDNNLAAIASGTVLNTLTVSSSTATFSAAMPDNVGVGDVIQYDSNNNGSVGAGDVLGFISGRTDSTHFSLETASGTAAVSRASGTVWQVFRAYTSLANAEAGTENQAINGSLVNFENWSGGRDIASTSEQWNIAAYGNGTTSDVTAVTVSGWNTAPQNYLKIYTPYLASEVGVSQRHQGKWDDGKYHLEITNFHDLYIQSKYVVIDGMQVKAIYSSQYFAVYVNPNIDGSITKVSNNIVRGVMSGSGNSSRGIFFNSVGGTALVFNNIVYDFINGSDDVEGIRAFGAGKMLAYNNTVYNCHDGISNDTAELVVKNNIAYSSTRYDYYTTGFDPDSDYNVSGDASAPGPHSKNSATVSFVDAVNDDFHLSPSDTAARGFGKDLSLDQNLPVTKDVDGQNFKFQISNFKSNPNSQISNVDIGADQSAVPIYRSVAPGLTTALDAGSEDGNRLTIATGTMTLATATPDNVGVGDVVQYDSDGNGSIDAIAFISGRASSSQYTVQNREGGVPVNVSNDLDWSVFRAYASLFYAEEGTENTGIADGVEHFDVVRSAVGGKDIYAANQQYNLAAYANGTTADTASFTVNEWTTYPTDYIRLYTPYLPAEVGISQRHQGVWDNNKYRLDIDSYYVIYDNENYVRIDGLQLKLTVTGSNWPYGILIQADGRDSDVQVSNNIIQANLAGLSNGAAGVATAYTVRANTKIWNNLVYGWGNGTGSTDYGILINSGYSAQIYNNTVYGCEYGIVGSSVMPSAKNNLSYNNSIKDFDATFDASSTNNLSKDATAPGLNPQISKTVIFADEPNKDFHLASNDTAARDRGADLSQDAQIPAFAGMTSSEVAAYSAGQVFAASSSVSTIVRDIDGHLRSTSTASGAWDIGADEGASAVYFSVGQNTSDHMTGTPNVTIAGGVATFDTPQTGTTTGVGDKVTYNTNQVVYITGKASTTVWTVRTATGTVPADIAGSGVVSITHAFASLEGAVDGGQANGAFDSTHLNTKDLYTNNLQLNIPCYYDSGPDTATVVVQGWTTAVPNYMRIYAPFNTTSEVNLGQRHSGKWDEGKYKLSVVDARALYVVNDYTRLDGLQIEIVNSTKTFNIGIDNIKNNVNIVQNIIRASGSTYDRQFGIVSRYFDGIIVSNIYDNVVYGFNNTNSAGIQTDAWVAGNKFYVYNNTVYDSTIGYNEVNSNYTIAKNNIAQNTAVGYQNSFLASSTNNLSDHADAPGSNPQNSKTVAFADAANKDFHLALTDTVARNVGADLSSDSNLAVIDDVDGQHRDVAVPRLYDVGADEAATPVYYSVGQDGTTDRKIAASVSIASSGLATFTQPQTGNIGVGDVIDYGASRKAYIVSKVNTSNWYVQAATGTVATTTGATVNSIKRAFSSLSLAEAGAPALLGTSDLFAGNYQLNLPCYYDTGVDGTGVTIDGWNTGAGNYIRVYTPASTTSESNVSQRHGGRWDDGKWRLEVVESTANIDNKINYTIINGLQLKTINSSIDYVYGIQSSLGDSLQVSNSLIAGVLSGTAGSGGGLGIAARSTTAKIWNNVIYGWVNGAYDTEGINTDMGRIIIYNNTINNCTLGIFGGNSSVLVKNTIAQNTGNGYSGSFDSLSNDNLSDHVDAPGLNPRNSKTVTFVDAANKDFHLASDDVNALDQGADLSQDANLAVVDDVDGQRRDESRLYDIGADEGATAVFYSVGQNILNHATGSPTITIASGTATFSVAQTATTTGVGDKVTYNASQVAYITGKSSTTVWTVRTATGTIPADITSSAVVSITHAFASLEGAVDATAGSGAFDGSHLNTKDLFADNYQLNVPCYYDSGPGTTAVVVDGWSTGANNYIKVYTPNDVTSEVNLSQRHAGNWDDAKFSLQIITGGPASNGIQANDNLKIIGLQFKYTSTNNGGTVIRSKGGDLTVDSNIIQGAFSGTATYCDGIMESSVSSLNIMRISNNVIYGIRNGSYGNCISTNDASTTAYVYGNTIYGCYEGVNVNGGVVVAKNNISYGNANNNYIGSFSASSTNNLSGPVLGGAPGLSPQNSKTVNFISTSTSDFHLDPADTSAKGQGADLSADPYLVIINDIDGDTRYTPWDIGADEAGASAPSVDAGQALIKIRTGVKVKTGTKVK